MPHLLGVFARLDLAVDDGAAHLALDGHAARVGVVVLGLQHAAQVLGADQDLVVVAVPHAPVELGRAVRMRVWWLRRALHDRVVVDARVHQDAPRAPALVEPVHAERLWATLELGKRGEKARDAYLHVDAANLDIEVLRQDAHLYGAAPRIRRLDPAAVIVGALLQHDAGVGLGLRLDGARDERA